MKNNILIWFLFPIFCFSQEKNFRGKIETGALLANVLVVNLTNQTETRTDGFGRFSIKAEEGDLLVFSGEFVRRKRFLIEEEHFGKENTIPLEVQDIEIEAVAIERFDINPENLGLVPEGQKRYTPAERRLRTATNWSPELGVGTMPGVSFSIDPIINTITGKTKMLKNLVEMEREDIRASYLSDVFNDDYFTEKLEIHADNITEFKYFSLYEILKNIPQKHRTNYIKRLSKNDLELFLIPLATKYLALKSEDK